MKATFQKRIALFVTNNVIGAARFALAVALAATLFIGSASAETYSLTTRVKPSEAGAGGLPSGKTYCDLTSSDTVNVTAANAQFYFNGVDSATLDCNIEISGDGYGNEKTGKFRMQMGSSAPVYLNGTVNLLGATKIASHNWSSNQGYLYFNGKITGAGSLVVAPGYLSEVHLNNTNSVNNYQGNTEIGSTGVYNNSGVTTYAGTLVLEADEQIPDVLTAGSSATGNLVLSSWSDASDRLTSTLKLGWHTETVNGLVCTDSLSVIIGDYGSKLRVGANNNTSTYAGKLQDGMQLEKIGTGTLTLSGENTHFGGTTLTAGSLVMSSETALGLGYVTFNGASTLKINVPNPTIQNSVTINSGVVGTIDTNGQNVTMTGYLEGEGGLNKTGAGTLTLLSAAYNGPTTVSEGTLLLTTSSFMNSTSVTVQSNAVFQTGASLSSSNVSVAGGTFIVGDSANRALIEAASLSLNGGSISFDMNNSDYNDSDLLYVSGDISLKSGSINLSFNSSDESSWWTKAGTDGIPLILSYYGAVKDLSNMQVNVNGIQSSNWSLTSRDNSIYLTAIGEGPGDAPYWFANTDDVNQDWDIDGTSKLGVKLVSGNNSVSYSNNVSMSANGSFEVADNYYLTIENPITGSGSLDKIGAGTLTLSQAPAYTGSTTISAGTLVLSAGGTLHNLAGSGKLDNNGQAVTVNNTENSQFSGVITGAGSLTKAGTGTLTLSGANDYAGGTTISAGTIKLTGEGALGSGAVTNNGILEFSPGEGDTMSIAYNISNNGSAKTVKSGAGTLTTSAWIDNNVDLQEGTLEITGGFGNGKRFNGQITIANGATLLCATHDSLGYGSSTTKMYIYGTMDNTTGNETLNNTELHMYGGTAKSSSGGTYDVLNTGVKFYSYALDGATADNPTVSTISGPIRLRTDGTFEITTAENSQLNLTGVISTGSGSCTVKKLGEGTLYINNTNSFSNPFTIAEGLVIVNSPNKSTGSFGSGVVTIESGATLEAHAHNPFGYGSPNNVIIRGTFIPATYTHITNVTLEGGVIEEEYAFASGGTGLDFGARTGTITSTGDSIIKCRTNINNTATVTYNVPSDTLTISGLIKGAGGFTKTGKGTLKLTAGNTYTGATNVSEGTFVISNTGTLASSEVIVATGATFIDGSNYITSNITLDGGTLTVGETSSTSRLAIGNLTLNSGVVNFDFNDASIDLNFDNLSASAVALMTGAINLTFNNNDENTWLNNSSDSGYVLINSSSMGADLGNLQLLVNSAETSNWYLTVADNNLVLKKQDGSEPPQPPVTELYYYANTEDISADRWTINGINKLGVKFTEGDQNTATFVNPVELNTNSLFEIGENRNLIVSGEVSGVGGLNKTGAGTLTLSGNNTYSGNTNITDGVLFFETADSFGTGNVSFTGTSTLKIGAPVTFAKNMSIQTEVKGTIDTNGNDMTISGVISGSGSLEKTGDGSLTLSKGNTFTGDVDITGGTVVMSYNAKNGNTTDTATAIGNPSIESRRITVHSGATLLTNNGSSGIDVFGGAEAHPAFRIVVDGGMLATATDNLTSYGDLEFKNGGVFEERGGHSTWLTIFNGDVYVTSGDATIQSTSSGRGISLRGYRDGTNPGVTFDIAKGSTLTLSALLKDNANSKTVGSFTKTGEGTMVINNGSSTYTGNITINQGIVKVTSGWNGSSASPLGGVTSGKTVTVNKGGELIFNAQDTFINAHSDSNFKFVVDGGKISNEGAFYNYLTNTTFRNGANLHASDGNATWKAYKLHNVTVARNVDGSAGAAVTFTADPNKPNATIAFGSKSSEISGGTSVSTITVEEITSADKLVNDNVADLVISAVIADPVYQTSGALKHSTEIVKAGAGTLKLTAGNTYTGVTTVSEGTLVISSSGTLASSEITVASGAAFVDGSNYITSKITLNGGTLTVGETDATARIVIGDFALNSGTINFDFNDASVNYNFDNLSASSAILSTGAINLTFNNGSETTWWTNSTDSGYVLINANTMGVDLDNIQLTVNSAATTSWYLTTSDNNLVLMKQDGTTPVDPPVTEPYYYVNTSDISASKWTMDGVNKKGVKFLEGDNAATFANPVEMNANSQFDIGADHNLTLSNVISGPGALNKTGDGTLTLTNNGSSFTGNMVIDEGVVRATAGWNNGNKTSALGKLQEGRSVIVNEDGELCFSSHDVLTNGETASLVPIVVNGGRLYNDGAFFNNLSNITLKNGASIYAEDGHANYKAFKLSNNVNVTRNDDDSAASPVLISGNPNNPNAAIAFNHNTTRLTVEDVTRNSGAATDDLPDLIISAPIADPYNMNQYETGNVEKLGEGTATFSGANTYTGLTYVSAGTLNITGSSFNSRLIVQTGGTAVIDAGDDGTINMSADAYYSSVMVGNGSNGTLVLDSGNVTIRNGSNTTGSMQLGTNGNCTGVLTLNGGTMQVDGRILFSANNNDAKGTLNMNDGTLTLGVPGSYTTDTDPSCGVLWFGQGTSTVNLNGGTISMFAMKFSGSGGPRPASTFNFNGGTLQAVADNAAFLAPAGGMKYYIKQGGAIIDTNGHNITITANIEQGTESADAAGGFTKKGEGTLTLTQAPAYTGSTTVEQGTMALAAGGILNNLSGGSLNNDGSVAVAAAVNASGQALTLNNTETSKFVGSITANTIEKTGAGTLKIRAEDPSSVTADSFTVSAGELDFRGQYNGDLFVANGSTLSPGNSVGDMTVYGNVTIDAGATGLFEFSSFTADKEQQVFDQMFITGSGSFILDPGSTIKLSFLSGDAGAWASAEDPVYQLVYDDNFVSEPIDLSEFLDTKYQGVFALEGTPEGLFLRGLGVIPVPDPGTGVPEPSTWALMILGALGLLYWRKRKNA